MNILVLIPVKRNLHPKLQLRCFHNVVHLQTCLQGQADIRLDFRGPGDAMVTDFRSMGRIENLCDVRQGMVDDYLKPEHEHVVMVDADVDYMPRQVMELLRTSKTDIVAPAVMGEGEHGKYWYDTWAFIDEDGMFVQPIPPHFKAQGRVVSMSCVGTMYVVPADLFREGAKYCPVKGFPDHLSVCAFARGRGRKVLCNQDVVVRHPRLADYGERRG